MAGEINDWFPVGCVVDFNEYWKLYKFNII